MGVLFGTDGIRGIVNKSLTVDLALKLGKATGKVLAPRLDHQAKVVIGMDTRASGEMLAGALAAGLCAMGVNVELVGVLPTPAVSYLVKKYGADAGMMISASHNPAEYNGIKVFGSDGLKIADADEQEIETLMLTVGFIPSLVDGNAVGKVTNRTDAVADYVNFITSTCNHQLGGFRVLIDCANGSASVTAGQIFGALGVDFTLIHKTPDGLNINLNCGSLHTRDLGKQVVAQGYDFGIAFDGDADRIQVVDHKGNLLDGDRLMAIFGLYLAEKGKLKDRVIVATVMSNLGLFHFAKKNNLTVVATKVGDRYVSKKMEKNGYCLGGEQSGHLILRDFLNTGDGQLAAVQLLNIVHEKKQTMEELGAVMETFPQVLKNLAITPEIKDGILEDPAVLDVVQKWTVRLGDRGRVLLRLSGTEPLLRVMAEGQDLPEVEACVADICRVIGEII